MNHKDPNLKHSGAENGSNDGLFQKWPPANQTIKRSWQYPIGSMGLVYLPTFTMKSTIHVGFYHTFRGIPIIDQLLGVNDL